MSIHATSSKQMRLGEILLMRGLVTVEGIEAALARQRREGGRLGENIVFLGLMSEAQLAAVLDETPTMPLKVAQTGISRGNLLALLLKFMRMESCETLSDLSEHMRLPASVLQELIDEATNQRLVHALGSTTQGIVRHLRYGLTDLGRAAAADALVRSNYLGPAPVPLAMFQAQVTKQALANEHLPEASLRDGFDGMIIAANHMRKLLPAVRAGRTILLYGPPGNGKTSIGLRLASLFRNIIFIPYAIEVNGQIIKMYDSRLHRPYQEGGDAPELSAGHGLQLETFDSRWVACRRPVVVAGGELSLEMLDLQFDPVTKLYDAPLHIKALNGLFLIDDFGRQKVDPVQLLNRWIVPLESRVDYLTLNTGVSFQIPFDELVVFSTNLSPAELMDPAFLRRIPYKIEILGPTLAAFREVFFAAVRAHGLTITDATFAHIVHRLRTGCHDLAYFQARFLCEQVQHICHCFSLPPEMTIQLADEALENLYVDLKSP